MFHAPSRTALADRAAGGADAPERGFDRRRPYARIVRVLLIEDDVAAQSLAVEELQAIADVAVASTLAEAEDAWASSGFDCVVLDLSLPDGWGLGSLLQLRRTVDAVPVIVLSGTQGPAFEGKALRSGAAKFLSKGDLAPGMLVDAVQEVLAADDAAASSAIAEVRRLGHMPSPVSRRMFGQTDYADDGRAEWDDLVGYYSDLLEVAIEEVAFESEGSVRGSLRDLAATLGSVRAGPRDVVRLHAAALEHQEGVRQGRSAPEFVHEARLVVLELMGYLASYYRAQALGASSTTAVEDDR